MYRFFLGAALLGAAWSARLDAQSACVAPDTASVAFIAGVRAAATSTEPMSVDARTRTKLPFTTPDKVTHVTDTAICQRIAEAISTETARAGRPPTTRVRVVRVVDTYVAEDPALVVAGHLRTYLLTKTYRITYRAWQ